MANPEKEAKAPDAAAAAVQPSQPEIHATTAAEEEIEISEKSHDKRPPGLHTTKSSATEASAETGATALVRQPSIVDRPKTRREKLNPLRWGKVRPVPEERIVSREHKANFFSILSFQWMQPFMSVSAVCCWKREREVLTVADGVQEALARE